MKVYLEDLYNLVRYGESGKALHVFHLIAADINSCLLEYEVRYVNLDGNSFFEFLKKEEEVKLEQGC